MERKLCEHCNRDCIVELHQPGLCPVCVKTSKQREVEKKWKQYRLDLLGLLNEINELIDEIRATPMRDEAIIAELELWKEQIHRFLD